ncbi:phosphatidylserine lipase ABHD16A-like [Scylla paramamosain]|uniref:phosphatidylserine lipase ABHD16A-like n=1 Tax=Scylla paramamosain TaxID=85552 RepID=UPI003082E921
MSLPWRCLMGPRLYKIYGSLLQNGESEVYVPNILERFGNKIFQVIYVVQYVGMFTSPILALSFYRWESLSLNSAIRLGTGLGLLVVVALVLRGAGRCFNPTYTTFLGILEEAQRLPRPPAKAMEPLRQYEFDFASWPVNFKWSDISADDNKARVYVERAGGVADMHGNIFSRTLQLPTRLVAYILTSSLGKYLMYPGCIQLLQLAIDNLLSQGREKLVKDFGGKRNKLLARDGNTIDTMLVDRRAKGQYPNGRTLVVCCEGNAGFYELGLMTTPLEAGYSVIGWNHPGFGGSTGSPYPSQEQNAVDAVMQFAIHSAGFREEDILIYGWSIGGYSSTWAAMNYPQISGLILDATFNHVLPLAVNRMPGCLNSIVTLAVSNHLNLNPGDQLARYPGPVTIVRRTQDEIITTDETQLRCNCGNDLMLRLIKSRYPGLLCPQATEVLWQWLAEPFQGSNLTEWGVDGDLCSSLLSSYIAQHGESYPYTIGEDMSIDEKTKMLLYLSSKYLVDVPSGHNNPLEKHFFWRPWRPLTDSYIQVD